MLVDITANQQAIREVTKLAFDSNVSLILAFSSEDAARYIETLKTYEHKSPDFIREKIDSNNFAKLSSALTKIRSVNKTDVVTLTSNFKVFIITDILDCQGASSGKREPTEKFTRVRRRKGQAYSQSILEALCIGFRKGMTSLINISKYCCWGDVLRVCPKCPLSRIQRNWIAL